MNSSVTFFKKAGMMFVLMLSVLFLHSQSARANGCGFSINADAIIIETQMGALGTKSITVTNTTDAQITLILRLDNSSFTFPGGEADTAILEAGASKEITITYTPNSAGKVIGTLSIVNSGANCEKKFTIYGKTSDIPNNSDGLICDPQSFSFGAVKKDVKLCKTVYVKNNTDQKIALISNWALKIANAEITITPEFARDVVLNPGEKLAFEICYTPDGSHEGMEDGLVITYSMDNGITVKTLMVSFYGKLDQGSNTGGDKLCLYTEQGDNYRDPVIIGGSAEHTLYLINNSDHDMTVTGATVTGEDAAVFTITSTFPIVVPAHTKNITLNYTFTPAGPMLGADKTVFYAYVKLAITNDTTTCESTTGKLIGFRVTDKKDNNTTDTVIRPLFPDEKRTLGMESNGKMAEKSFYFVNNLDVDATVNKIYLAEGTYFTITSTNPTPTPFVLHPGDKLTVIVKYSATDNLVHYDKLMIEADHQLVSTEFDLQAVQLVAASVANILPVGVAVSVSPNPASNFIKVDMSGIRSADVQIIDLLGNTVASAKANTTWRWDAMNIFAGSYIVRIAGESVNGEQFVNSQRVVLTK